MFQVIKCHIILKVSSKMKFNVYLLIEVYFIIELEIEFDSIVWGVLDSCYFFQPVDNEEVLEVFGSTGKR